MSEIGRGLDNAARFLLDPSNHIYSPAKKGVAWTATVVMAIQVDMKCLLQVY